MLGVRVCTAIAAGVAFAGGVLRSLSSVVSVNHGRRLGDAGVQNLQELTAKLDLAEFDKPGFHDAMQRAGQEAGQRPVRLSQDLTAVLVAGLSLLMMTALLAQVELWLPVMVGLAAVVPVCACPAASNFMLRCVVWLRGCVFVLRCFVWFCLHMI